MIAVGICLTACSQKAEQKTFVYEGNPIVRDNYTADPAPMIASDGRLYVFCGIIMFRLMGKNNLQQ